MKVNRKVTLLDLVGLLNGLCSFSGSSLLVEMEVDFLE